MTEQQGFDLVTSGPVHWVEVGNRLASADDREVLASVLNRVKNVGEVAGRLGGAYFRHKIRLSDQAPISSPRLVKETTEAGPLDRQTPDRCSPWWARTGRFREEFQVATTFLKRPGH